MAAMLYEAVAPEKPVCLYSHHELEFPINLEYLDELRARGFVVKVVNPFLEYFELMERGIGFLTQKDPWCVPMLVGTGILAWLQEQGLRSPREAVMFRGMSGSEHSHSCILAWNSTGGLTYPRPIRYCRLPRGDYRSGKSHYGLPLNPIYQHMDRTYCICCYTSDARRQSYSRCDFPEVCTRYYSQIEKMLFDSGLIEKAGLRPEHQTREEKLDRHGFVHWNRIKSQNIVGAVRRCGSSGTLVYRIRDPQWIDTKHLAPLKGRWCLRGSEVRFWDMDVKEADTAIKRMVNCLIVASVLWSVFVADATTASPKRFVLTDACSVVGVFE